MKKIYLFFLILIVYSCKDFIESPVTDEKVSIVAPGDGMESNKYAQQFWWEPVEDATSYRLQIVSPSFSAAQQLVIDTLTAETKFAYTLEPGNYQWRIRAENSSSTGIYTTRSFTIHESSIEHQQVQLSAPSNGLLTNKPSIDIQWLPLFDASAYVLQIDSANFTDEANMVVNQELSVTTYRFAAQKDADYRWRVKAKNSEIESKWSAVYGFTRDATPPAKVSLVSPVNDYSAALPVVLRWNTVTGASKYQLSVYKSDGTTPFNNAFPMVLTGNSYSFNAGEYNETLYWNVKALDEAGNIGEISDTRRFTVQ